MIRKFIIISIHLLLSSVGALEYYLAKGMRRFTYRPGSHYTARLPYDHPAYEDIIITLQKIPQEPRLLSHMLSSSTNSKALLYSTWTIPLN